MKNEEIEILQIVQKFGKENNLNPFLLENFGLDGSFEKDLGLDSLARMELISQIEEHFKASIPENVIATLETPRDLLRAIAGNEGKIVSEKVMDLTRELVGPFPGETSTLVGILEWHFKNHPDLPHIKVCLDSGEEEILTFRKLWEESGKVASSLINNFGILPGNTIALMLPMGRDYFFTFMGIMRAGAIPVPLYPPYNIRQVQTHILRHCNILMNCNAFMLITVEEAKPISEIIQSKVESLKKVVVPNELIREGGPLNFSPSPKNTAFIQYTSGSTGTPKGVVLSHENLLANIKAMGGAIEISSKDVFVSWLPLYHDLGLIGGWFGCLYFSSLLAIMSPLSFLAHPIKWLRTIQKNKGTISGAPNFAFELCLKRIKDEELKGLDLSSLRLMFNGAEQVVPKTIREFSEKFSRYGFKPNSLLPVYGLAENSLGLTIPNLSYGPKIDSIDRKKFLNERIAIPSENEKPLEFVSCGHPLEDFEIKIVDELGKELPPRHAGQIQFRGPSSSSGYYKNPEATKNLFDGEWLNSGDLGYIADGELFITGRIKDIIIHGGRNLFPEEIEQAIGEIEGIRKGCVAVFGSFEPQKGTERLVVVAETRETSPSTLTEMQKKINGKVVDLIGSAPEVVVLAPPHSVLKTLNGKIRRSATRDLFESGNIGKGERFIWFFYLQIFFANLQKKTRSLFSLFFEIIYTIYFWVLIGIVSAPSIIFVILIPFENLRWAFIRFTLKLLSKFLGIGISVSGLENIKVPSILVSNHASYLDALLLSMSLPYKISFVAKEELKSNFLIHMLLNRLNTKFVERFDVKKGAEEIQQLRIDLPKDRLILFFPEGTFVRKPGLLPFKMGAFVLAGETGYSLLPISIRGTRNILPSDSWIPKRGNINLIIGEKIFADRSKKGWEGAIELRNLARGQILLHCGEPDLSYEKSPIQKMKS